MEKDLWSFSISIQAMQTLFFNANVVTHEQKNATAFIVENSRFIAVGNQELVDNFEGEKVDLMGKTVIPGFIDAHIHIWKVGSLMTHILDVRGIKSIAEIQTALRDFITKNPHLTWVVARGFNESNLEENRMPTKIDLDEITQEKPIFLQRTCAHIAVVNSKGLEIAQISAETQAPQGGEIRLDENNKPNGILCETAMGLATTKFDSNSFEDYKTMIFAAANEMIASGITTATDPAVMPDLLTAYKKLDQENALPIRVNAIPIVLPDGEKEAIPLTDIYKSDFLTVNTVKFFSDGGLSGKTAALKRHYKNSIEKGILRLNPQQFEELATEAHQKGFRIATHAIGDAAIDLVLDVYEKINIEPKLPHRIEHLGLPDAKQMERIVKNDFWVVTQPIFIKELGKNFRLYLDDEYQKQCYPYKTQLENKVQTAFSSDAPVVKDFRPLTGIQSAVTRKDAEGNVFVQNECISVEQALKAYTIDAAKANGQENEIGSIAVGKFADFVVLDKNILTENINQIDQIKVISTYIGGIKK